jgi:hypothetical protein
MLQPAAASRLARTLENGARKHGREATSSRLGSELTTECGYLTAAALSDLMSSGEQV